MLRRFVWCSIAAVLLITAFGSQQAVATTVFCVTSGSGGPTQFDNAMKYWVNASDETVYVHLEQGTYNLNPASESSVSYNQNGAGNASLHLVGGFVPGTSPPCSTRVLNPANTVISGQANGPVSTIDILQSEGEMLIDGVTFTKFGDGVSLQSISSSTMTLRNIAIVGNGSGDLDYPALFVQDFGAGGIGLGSSTVRVENCLIAGNNSHGMELLDDDNDDVTQVLGCTIADNTGYGLLSGDPSEDRFKLNGSLTALNVILRNNALADVYIRPGGNTPTIAYSNVASISGAPATTSHNQNTDPKFVGSGANPYELQTTSPLINIGAPASLVSGGTYAGTDIRGRTRVIGSHIDFGAYESTVDDTADQTVTSPGDTTATGTLRAAITTANANPNPTTIKFDIAGSCPKYIALNSLLPDITSDVTIDGYTQPGAAPNSAALGYDGTICIILVGSGLDHGFKTSGTGRLTVRGVDFDDFSTAAIRLSSGAGHVVTGNGFTARSNDATEKTGVLIEGSATYSQIGSYAFGDRNVFAQSTDAAIKLASNGAGHHVIQGNYIGFNFDGTKRTGNQDKYGITLQDSGSNEISYNFIGSSQLYGLLLSGAGSNDNRIFENAIGVAPANDAAAGNGAGTGCLVCFGVAAVELTSGAHDNYIGAISGGGGSNVIANNYAGGVYVDSTAGTGNRIYGNNLIHDNGGELAIDLGGLGPTLNDVGDADTGGNNLQNYPTLSQAMRIGADVIRLSGSLVAQTGVAPQGYRLDIYWTDTCLFNGGGADTPRGEMKRYVGFMDMYSDGTQFNVPFSNVDIIAATSGLKTPGYLFAIATDSAGNTSEPGPCRAYFDDYIFANGFN